MTIRLTTPVTDTTLFEAREALFTARMRYDEASRMLYDVIGFGTSVEIKKADRRVSSALRGLRKAERLAERLEAEALSSEDSA